MPRITDELDGLRASLQERIVSDFDLVLKRHRTRRRHRFIAGGTGAIVLAVTIGLAVNATTNRSKDTVTTAQDDRNNSGQNRIAITDPPCGFPSQQLLTPDEARARLGDQLVLPTDVNANASNVDTVALCGSGETVITFTTGVWVYFMSHSGAAPDWKKAVADDPNESVLGSVRGQPAWVITPDTATERRGSVTFIDGPTQIVVEGNMRLSGDALQKIASSIPSLQAHSNAGTAGFVVGYVPAGFHPDGPDADAAPPPANLSSQTFRTDGSRTTRESLTVDVLRGDFVSDAKKYAADNGHLRLVQIGGRQGAVGWNVHPHDGTGLHLAYVVVGDGVAVEVVEITGRDATALSDEELIRVAASVKLT